MSGITEGRKQVSKTRDDTSTSTRNVAEEESSFGRMVAALSVRPKTKSVRAMEQVVSQVGLTTRLLNPRLRVGLSDIPRGPDGVGLLLHTRRRWCWWWATSWVAMTWSWCRAAPAIGFRGSWVGGHLVRGRSWARLADWVRGAQVCEGLNERCDTWDGVRRGTVSRSGSRFGSGPGNLGVNDAVEVRETNWSGVVDVLDRTHGLGENGGDDVERGGEDGEGGLPECVEEPGSDAFVFVYEHHPETAAQEDFEHDAD